MISFAITLLLNLGTGISIKQLTATLKHHLKSVIIFSYDNWVKSIFRELSKLQNKISN